VSFEEVPYDPTYAIILDYYKIFNKTKWLVGAAIFSGVLILLCFFYLLILLPTIANPHMVDSKKIAILVLVFATIFATATWLIINSVPLLSWYVLGGRRKKRQLLQFQSKIIKRSYLTNFETVTPEGRNSTERIFNHLSLVFPQVYEVKLKRIKKGLDIINTKKKNNLVRKMLLFQNYDLIIKTSTGLFMIKIFENEITFNDIENTVKILNRQQIGFKMFGPAEIARVIIVLKNIQNLEIKQFAENIQKLDRRFSLDIVQEESELGYSTIWID
jgi:hypothetical protein